MIARIAVLMFLRIYMVDAHSAAISQAVREIEAPVHSRSGNKAEQEYVEMLMMRVAEIEGGSR